MFVYRPWYARWRHRQACERLTFESISLSRGRAASRRPTQQGGRGGSRPAPSPARLGVSAYLCTQVAGAGRPGNIPQTFCSTVHQAGALARRPL